MGYFVKKRTPTRVPTVKLPCAPRVLRSQSAPPPPSSRLTSLERMRVWESGRGGGGTPYASVDRLLERGDSVIVVDNFFTGRKENIMHHLQNPFFEMIRHDVVEPILAGRPQTEMQI